jgi:hypothetical protein
MSDIQHPANDGPGVRIPAGEDDGRDLGSAASSDAELERLMRELRDDERVVVELVLDCLRAQQAMTRQVLEWLYRHHASEASPAESERGNGLPIVAVARTEEPSPAPPPSGKGLISRWRRRVRACAVCKREASRASTRDLSSAGWAIAGQTGICPECRSTGWRVSDRGGLPFRPRSSGAPDQ